MGLWRAGDLPSLTSPAPQAELIVGDQSGAIHIWDLKTDHNEQLIPEPEVSITSAHIDPDASYMAAVNSTVSPGTECLLPYPPHSLHVADSPDAPSDSPTPHRPASSSWLQLQQPPKPESWVSFLTPPSLLP